MEPAPPSPAGATPEPLRLGRRGWLGRLLLHYLAVHDPDEPRRAVTELAAAHPGAAPATLASRLALRRLERVGLRPGIDLIGPSLRGRLEEDADPAALARIGVLTTQWDVVMDIAHLYGNRSGVVERALEILTIMAMRLRDLALARRLHEAALGAVGGRVVDPAGLAKRVEARLVRGTPRDDAGLSVGPGLAFLEARTTTCLASLYFERAAIEEEGVRALHRLDDSERLELIEVLIALAWADGQVAPAERRLIQQQIALAGFEPADARRLLARLDRPVRLDALDLQPMDASTRRFVLEQAILLSLIDDDQHTSELEALAEIAVRLGGSQAELERTLVEVAAFHEANRDLRQVAPEGAGALGRLRAVVTRRARAAVRSNMRAIVTEIKETGELAKLLGAASVRELTPDEARKVKSQLLDICKTIPALALFALPGGGILLPIVIKLLPFDILPTAFNERDEPQAS